MSDPKLPAAEWKDYPEPECLSGTTYDACVDSNAYRKAKSAIKKAWLRMQAGETVTSLGYALVDEGLTALPPEIGQLSALTELYLHNNQLTALPPEIGQLSALTALSLGNNLLTALPPEIGQLTVLTKLSLSNNQLTALPPEIGQLTALTELSLSNNQLTALPPEIGQLTALTELYLGNNLLTALPPELRLLTTLSSLNLAHNKLTELPPEIGWLVALSWLDLAHNKLTLLPPEIGHLPALSGIILDDNQLTELPPVIGRLTTLTELYLESNQLTALPPELRGLTKLTRLNLYGNEALCLPPELLGKPWDGTGINDKDAPDPQAVLDFYFSREEEAEAGEAPRSLNEVKVLLVGRGEAGKTSVSRALRGEQFNRDERETPGIVIEDWRMACPQGAVTAHLWDFAGQEITHETHRSFLTDRSLYLIVLDGRGGQQMEEADYWLEHVKKYGGGTSPALVVLNKWRSPGPYDMARRQLQREHPCLRGFVETDCADGYGIAALREAMCALVEDMPGVRQEWAASYFRVSAALKAQEKKGRYFLSWKEYGEVCRSCQVAAERDEPLAENLNALGVALYYGHNPALRDTRVLRPQWAADGLYGLIQGVRVRPHAAHPGELRAGELRDVLMAGLDVVGHERKERKVDKQSYDTVEVQAFLLELLLDREIALRGGGEGAQAVYLLPGLLPVDEPEVRDYDVAAHMEQAAVRWRWLYEFLPAGVMSRFIVKTHALSDAQPRWQQGVVLEWGGAQALVLAERRRNPRVEVYLKGGSEAERLALAGMVRAFMENIHRDLPEGLRGKEELDLSLPGEQWTEVAELAEFEKAHKTLPVRTRGGIVEVRPTQELNRLEPESARREDAPRLKVFVSYSHDDYKDCDQMKLRLARLANEGLVDYWHDGQIRPGQEWDKVIRRELEDADVVILLMSEGFFKSRYIEGVEVATARARQQRGEADILPVLLEECDGFKKHPWLGQLQTVPSVTGRLRPVRRFTPKMTAWDSVENELRRMIADLAKSKHRSGRRGY